MRMALVLSLLAVGCATGGRGARPNPFTEAVDPPQPVVPGWQRDCQAYIWAHGPDDPGSLDCRRALWAESQRQAQVQAEAQAQAQVAEAERRQRIVNMLSAIGGAAKAMQTPPAPRKMELECHPDPFSIPPGGQVCKER